MKGWKLSGLFRLYYYENCKFSQFLNFYGQLQRHSLSRPCNNLQSREISTSLIDFKDFSIHFYHLLQDLNPKTQKFSSVPSWVKGNGKGKGFLVTVLISPKLSLGEDCSLQCSPSFYTKQPWPFAFPRNQGWIKFPLPCIHLGKVATLWVVWIRLFST